jgi:hypothetical protein
MAAESPDMFADAEVDKGDPETPDSQGGASNDGVVSDNPRAKRARSEPHQNEIADATCRAQDAAARLEAEKDLSERGHQLYQRWAKKLASGKLCSHHSMVELFITDMWSEVEAANPQHQPKSWEDLMPHKVAHTALMIALEYVLSAADTKCVEGEKAASPCPCDMHPDRRDE